MMLAMLSAPWSDESTPDLTGRTAVVTGADSGIGLACVRHLAGRGAVTVMACRDLRRGEAAMSRVRAGLEAPPLQLRRLDLADLASVRVFASEMRTAHPRIDILINSAGVVAIPRRTTADGFEMQFGVNHLGHFALTGLLLPSLTATRTARVVTATSLLHAVGRIDFDDLMGERRYRPWPAYAQSKLANLLFAIELARRTEPGRSPTSVSAHPGLTEPSTSGTGSAMGGRAWLRRLVGRAGALAGQSPAQGARPLLHAATASGIQPGWLIGPARYGGTRGEPARGEPSSRATDTETARRLWEVSVELTGVEYAGLE